MRGLKSLLLAGLFAAGSAVSAHVQPALAQSTLRIGLAEDADMLDPTLARTFVGRIVFASLCDKLFDIDASLKIVPQLATGYKWSEDGLQLTITLRQNVLFHDGTKMDAAAVKYSLDRHLTMAGTARKAEIGAIDHIDVVDPSTVKLTLKTKFAPLLAQLSDRAGMIVSPAAAQAEGDKFQANPVCAGPFKFSSRVAQDRIVLDRFTNYWDKDKIHFDRLIFLPITDASVRRANLQSGSLDLIERLQPTDLEQLKGDAALKSASAVEIGYSGVTINVGKPADDPAANTPLGQDARVRQAFDLAIDRDAINQAVFSGQFVPANQWVPPNSQFYDKGLPVPKRDVEKAKALLKAAGQTKVTVDFMVPSDSQAQAVGQVIQATAGEAGFDMQIHTTEFARSLDLAGKGQFGAFFVAWSGRVDPDGNIASQLTCRGAINYSKYCNPDFDKEIDAAAQTEDPAERQKHYNAAMAIESRDLPISYVFHRRWMYAFSSKLQGFVPYSDGLIRPQGLRLQ